jgi:hypothetical protein
MGVLVLHSTEGGWLSALATFNTKPGTQPHRVIDPAQDIYKDFIPWDKPAKSLTNASGGVETNNRGGVYQVEIVGFAKLIPSMSDEWYRVLVRQLKEICALTGVPIKFPCKFVPVGQVNPLSLTDWLSVEGIIGHQHVPENTNGHTDPGDISKIEIMMTKREITVDKDTANKVINAVYLVVLDRDADPGGRDYWAGILINQGFEAFIVSFLANAYSELAARKAVGNTTAQSGITVNDVVTAIIAKLAKS